MNLLYPTQQLKSISSTSSRRSHYLNAIPSPALTKHKQTPSNQHPDLSSPNTACTTIKMQTLTFLPLLSLLTTTTALGINCRGSSDCGLSSAPSMGEIVSIIEEIPDNAWYNNGEHITCIASATNDYSICAFLQNSGGAPGSSIKTLARELQQHGCQNCGSIPLFFPNDNDVSNGELTVNVVA
ncbi:Kp4-domain-containing protein [Aspergillus karnatakaensis]|uniref:Kp4-domain-containing protein n=1 Tax=Aspergillus karnatakaensis TaxID=1810916 RepID=UPI003CCDC3C6